MVRQTYQTTLIFRLSVVLILLLLPQIVFGADPPKQILSAKIQLKVDWDQKDGAGNQRTGKMQINLQGLLKLNRQFSSLEQGLPAVMVPYTVTTMTGSYTFEETRNTANRNHCSNPDSKYEDQGTLVVEPYPGPGNLMLHYMGKMSEELAQIKHMAPAGAFDTLIDRYLFAVTLPKKEARGKTFPDQKPCEAKDIKQSILGDKIEIHFKFNDDGTMSGRRSWSANSPPSAYVSVADLPEIFNAKPYSPSQASPGNISFDLRWEIKEPSLARIFQEVELPSGKKTWLDITDSEAEVTVGKRLRFKGVILPKGKTDKPAGNWQLEGSVGGKHKPYFKYYDAEPRFGRVIALDPQTDLKNKHMITLFWSGGDEGAIHFSTTAGGERLTAQATLKVIKPKYRVDIVAQQGATIGPAFTGGTLNKDCMGSGAHGAAKNYKWWLQYDGIDFKAENLDKGTLDGEEQWVQMLRRHDLWVTFDDQYKSHQFTAEALDVCYPYQRGSHAIDRPGVPLSQSEDGAMIEQHEWVDNNGNPLKPTTGTLLYTQVIQDCRMVLMFRPKGKKDETEWVPLKEILWSWHASASYSQAYKWQLNESKVIPTAPAAADTGVFPEWEKNSADSKSYTVK